MPRSNRPRSRAIDLPGIVTSAPAGIVCRAGQPRGQGQSRVVRISHKHRFVFFAFPKTGSESIREALNPISDVAGEHEANILKRPEEERPGLIPNHISPRDLRSFFRERGWPFEDYYRFMFVRNPWARLVSLYEMIRHRDERFDAPFDRWLLNSRPDKWGGGEGEDAPLWCRYGTYSVDAYASDEDGQRLVDKVYRLDDMWQVPADLRRHNIPIPHETMPWINRGPRRDLSQYYTTPALRAVVATRYAKDIAEFGYAYPSRPV